MNRKNAWLIMCTLAGSMVCVSAANGAPKPETHCAAQIEYRSDTDTAYHYLEALQRQIYESNKDLTDPYSRAELESPRSIATFAELKARALKACPDPKQRSTCALDPAMADRITAALPCLTLPTRFEAPLFNLLINLHTGELAKIRARHFPQSPATRFGSLPTGTFDAQAILPPGGKDPLVILNRDLFFFTGALSKAISDAIPITMGGSVSLDYSEEGIRRRLREHPYIAHNFADAMSRLVHEGSSKGALEVTLDEPHNHLHVRLLTAMDMFLIAHEESHIILRHVSDRTTAFRLAGGSRRQPRLVAGPQAAARHAAAPARAMTAADLEPAPVLKAQSRTRTQELQADELGFTLMMWAREQSGNAVDLIIAAAAPQMVFRVLDAADAYGAESGNWTFSDQNHPSAAERIKGLEPVFSKLAKGNDHLQVDFRIAFDAAFRVLLAAADASIRENLELPPARPK